MLPNFLLEEQTVSEDGEGPAIALGSAAGKTLGLTLGITDVQGQQSLDVEVYGSPDGAEWSASPLTSFAQQFYKGISSTTLDLGPTPDVRYLQARWKVGGREHSSGSAMFRFYLFAEVQNA